MKRLTIFITYCLFATVLLHGQSRQGNIVQYFGKEKVENISEGDVIHIFKDGLIIGGSSFPIGNSTVSTNNLFAKYLLNEIDQISAGKTESEDMLGKKLKWEKISVNDKNEFDNKALRGSGYLYLTFDSPNEQTVLFEASGHTDILINGFPHEGDHYDYGWSLIPVKLKKGINEFLLRGGRFPRMRARILAPYNLIQLTTRDMTLPDLLIEENEPLYGAIRIINAKNEWLKNAVISCKIDGEKINFNIPSISPMNIRKVPFKISYSNNIINKEKVKAIVTLKNDEGKTYSIDTLELNVKSKFKHHKRTFISSIDESVQYYSIAPSSNPNIENPAMFLSVHGASVEAVNQANAYDQKDWGHLVAPTNRRPFGFAWENWGRIDALEVLNLAEKLLKTDPSRTYLTGHSMGGHGTWQIGVNHPDRFAAIAPCAGYADLLGYRRSFAKRLKEMSDAQVKKWGFDKQQLLALIESTKLKDKSDIMIDSLIRRSGNPSRTLKLKRNYLHHGVFILHGEKDNVVPTRLAREMREELGKFHNDFSYYEYPDGTHWYGDHSVDWPPLFNFFKDRKIKKSSEIKNIEFYTGSPGVSSGSHFIDIIQQEIPMEISSFDFNREEKTLSTKNVQTISINVKEMGDDIDTLTIDEQEYVFPETDNPVYLMKNDNRWKTISSPSLKEKGPHRNGSFKDAFNNYVVLVYATQGSQNENEWYYNRARYDAETFGYLGNGSFEIVKDTEFELNKFKDRNVVLYGNKNNNAAWKKLLDNCPIQVTTNNVKIGEKELAGGKWGAFFIYPRFDSNNASVGVVTASGEKGMKAAFANDYLGRDAFPDIVIFDETMMVDGIPGIKCTGFFGNDWTLKNGDIVWK